MKTTAFGARVRELREAAGLSQQALADLAGMHRQGVHKLEAGEREPAWGSVLALAKALGVSVAAFEEGSAPRPPESTALDQSVFDLLDELDEIGRMHQARMSPVIVRIIATKLRRALGAPPAKRKGKGNK